MFGPKWVRALLPDARPSRKACRSLEDLRVRAGIPEQWFTLHVAGHPVVTRAVLMKTYERTFARLLADEIYTMRRLGRSNENNWLHTAGQLAVHGARCAVLAERVRPEHPDDPFGLKSAGLLRYAAEGRTDLASALLSGVVDRYATTDELIDALIVEENRGLSVATAPDLQWVADEVTRILELDMGRRST